ncbi:MAG: NAD(P)H-dependent oxidoreductase subunit E [Bacteroidetes bacterium]|nr:NAD(P)H-dependent oxidoreductase subunit E [Bacteroidota bacterium]
MDHIFEKYILKKPENLIPLLQEIQKENGYLTDEIIERVSAHLNIPTNKIYGVATFYDQFRFKQKGKYHIQVCRGTSCYLCSSTSYLKEIEKLLKVKAGSLSRDKKFSFETVSCMGGCSQSPVIRINDKTYHHLSLAELHTLIRSLREKTE